MRLSVLFAVLLVGPVLAGPVPKKQEKKTVGLDGTWEVVERHGNGQRDDPARPIRWTIDGESVVIAMRGKAGFQPVEGTTYRLVKPDGGKPNEIDFVLTHTDDRDHTPSTFRGVFELDADTFRLSTASASTGLRPAKCHSTKDASLLIFKRVGDGKS